MKKLDFVIQKTGINFREDGEFWKYDGKFFDPEKVFEMVLAKVNRGLDTTMPENWEDKMYYLKSFGPMC